MDKTMCELFAGVGGFRLGFDRLKTGWNTVWFSQWEPGARTQWAHDCYVQHFGESEDVNGELHTGEDISTVNKENIPNHSLLVGGFPCLTGETLVLTKDGYKQLKDVKKGDSVLSHDGSFNEVTNFFNQGIKRTYVLDGYGFENIHATENHRFYVRERYYSYKNKEKTKKFTNPEWVTVDKILGKNPKDVYFGSKINTNSIVPTWNGVDLRENAVKIKHVNTLDMTDKNLWYLVGRYLSDGWSEKQQKNEELTVFLEQFGAGAKNKRIPGFVFDMPIDLLAPLIEGYFDSDGCKIENRLQFTTISRELAYGMTVILEKVYCKPCQVHLTKVNSETSIEGRIVHQNDFYIGRCILESQHESAFYEDGYIWKPLHKITECGEEHVYDIEVENTHSFIANGVITHNCQDYSVAHSLSSSKGIEGKKGVLWWQIRDTLIAKQTPFCLLENVDRLLKSPAKQRGRDFGVILACLNELGYSVEWRVVNAAQYGAGQRRRRTFIFAYKNDTKYGLSVNGIAPEQIIGEKGFMVQAFPITEMGTISQTELTGDILNVSDTFKFGFENSGYMHDGRIYTAKVIEKEEEPIKLGTMLEKNVDDKFYITTEKMAKWTYLKGSKKIPRKTAEGHEYVFSEGPIAFPDPWDKPARTMLTSETTLNRSSHVVSDPGTGRLRTLTPVEAERIQGFDDGWTDSGMPDRMRYFCMGNALVVPMITRMGKILDKIIAKED